MKIKQKIVIPPSVPNRNPMAAQLSAPQLRNRIVPCGKVYVRKSRTRNKEFD